jgi:hypothetical protein
MQSSERFVVVEGLSCEPHREWLAGLRIMDGVEVDQDAQSNACPLRCGVPVDVDDADGEFRIER